MRTNNSSTTTLIAVALLLLILFVSIAYLTLLHQPAEPPQDHELVGDLLQNLQTWEDSRPLSYRYVVHRKCSCTRENSTAFVATEERGQKMVEFVVSVESSNRDKQDDGKVSVESTKVEGMTDFITIAVSHPFIMESPEAIEQAKTFIKTGQFTHDAPE